MERGKQRSSLKHPLAGEYLEREVAALALSEDQREPERSHGINHVDLFYIAEVDRVQADIGDQLLNLYACLAARTAIEEISRYAVKDGIGEVFPTERIKGPEETRVRRV